MTHCIKCNRPLRLPSPDGYGPVCRKAAAKPLPAAEDLFGFRPEVFAQERCGALSVELVHDFAALRQRRMGALDSFYVTARIGCASTGGNA
jgi:hypothetical protein